MTSENRMSRGKKNKLLNDTSLYSLELEQSNNQFSIVKSLKNTNNSSSLIAKLRNEFEILNHLKKKSVLINEFALTPQEMPIKLIFTMNESGDFLNQIVNQKKKFELKEFLDLAIKITSFLEKIHNAKTVHHQINPQNIFITATNEVLILNFEMSSTFFDSNSVNNHLNISDNTLSFISPEQTRRMNRLIDYRTDFYSLGIVFYQILCGELPFIADNSLDLIYSHIARTPTPPHIKNRNIPEPVSRIIMKLLAKNAEDRYQSATGLKNDLIFCFDKVSNSIKLENFVLGQKDISKQLQIPQKLYGRESEKNSLLEIFNSTIQGNCEFALVSGYSGIGKTVLVNELQKPVTEQKGFFVSGKYDQFQSKAPYFAIIQAVRKLIQTLLSEKNEVVIQWKNKILAALGNNGQIIIEIIPELELIIGKQDVPFTVGLIETKARFIRTFQQFISVFAKKEHPLVIFIDDLQWIDLGSLDLLKSLFHSESYLCLIGSYRENEMSPEHPLMQTVSELKKIKKVSEIFLKPLSIDDLNLLLSESLFHPKAKCQNLAELIHKKTSGNPFFVNQFLKRLYDENLLYISETSEWSWNLENIKTLNVTDNVVDLMSDRVKKLPLKTQNLIKFASCMGSSFEYIKLSQVLELKLSDIITHLNEAISAGLLISSDDYSLLANNANQTILGSLSENQLEQIVEKSFCRFSHDRIQQAAYELTSEQERLDLHLKIGKLLLSINNNINDPDNVIDIVNHLNHSIKIISSEFEKLDLATLNLKAAKKANLAAAYQAASSYSEIGINLLGENKWSKYYQICSELFIIYAESKNLLGQIEESSKILEIALSHAKENIEKANIKMIQVRHLAAQGKYAEAVQTGITGLNDLGINLPSINQIDLIEPAFIAEYMKYREALKHKTIESFYDLSVNSSPEHELAVALLVTILDSAIIGPSHFVGLITAKTVSLSLERGNTPYSAVGYCWIGIVEIAAFQNYSDAYKLGQLSVRLTEEKFRNTALLGNIFQAFATYLLYLKQPCVEAFPYWDKAYTECMNIGDHLYATYSAIQGARQSMMWNCSSLQASLELIEKQTIRIKQLNNIPMYFSILAHKSFIISLIDPEKNFQNGDFEGYKESDYRAAFSVSPLLIALVENFRLAQLTIGGFYQEALKIIQSTNFAPIETFIAHAVEYRYFSVLTYSSEYENATPNERIEILKQIQNHSLFLEKLATECPENFSSLDLTVKAELAKLEGSSLEKVLSLFDKAIENAKKYNFLNYSAIASERASLFCLNRGYKWIAKAYLIESHQLFIKWGATSKVQQLEKKYSEFLFSTNSSKTVSNSTTITNEMLDLETVLKMSQTMSSEIIQERLIIKMLNVILESAGAQTAIFAIEKNHNAISIRARADQTQSTLLDISLNNYFDICHGVINFVQRTQKELSIDNIESDERFNSDLYIQNQKIKSVLCLPVLNHGRALGYLYLENNLIEGAFKDDRVAVLKLLASQAAISLENSALYSNLEQRVTERTQELNESLENLKTAQVQLTNSSKLSALGQMAGGIAHEINSPLAIISLHTQSLELMLKNNNLDIARAEKGISIILNTVKRIAKIITALRTFSRDGSKDKFENISAKDLVDQTIELCKERFTLNNYKIEITDISQNISIPCRATEISQVLLNLLNNAYDAIEGYKERWVNIRVVETTEFIEIRVTDSGNGISQEIKDKLFDPFFTTKDVGKGTGLGLSISQGIIQKHSGKLWVDSSSKHTCFVISLPKKQTSDNISAS